MKISLPKKFNHAMALQWLVFIPIILPLCIVYGAAEGIANTVEKMAHRMWQDMEL
jgi:Na+-translocating ferredoxin:NAD+ oxidoreductase RnfE subunit